MVLSEDCQLAAIFEKMSDGVGKSVAVGAYVCMLFVEPVFVCV